MSTLNRMLAVALATAGLAGIARAVPEPGSPAIHPAAGYATVVPNGGNPFDVTVTATKPGYGVFWVCIFPGSGEKCSLSPVSNSVGWSTQPTKGAAVWRTNNGSGANGKTLVVPGEPGRLSNPNSGVFVAQGGCATAQYVIHVINFATGNTFWTTPNGPPPPPPPPPAPGSLCGTVVCRDTVGDTPLADVPVTLVDATGAPVGSKQTDDDGKYCFDNLAPGQYTVSVPPEFDTKPIIGSPSATVAVVSNQTTIQDFAYVCSTPPVCTGILLFGPDLYMTHWLKDWLVQNGIPTEHVTVAQTSGTTYEPDALANAIAAYRLEHNGNRPCTMLFDSEFIGPNGQWTGLGPSDQALLQSLIFDGMGLVYSEPTNLANQGLQPDTPLGQLPLVVPVTPHWHCDPALMYDVIPGAESSFIVSPLMADMVLDPTTNLLGFSPLSSCQNQQVDLEPVAAAAIGAQYLNPVGLFKSGGPNTWVEGWGGTTVWTLDCAPLIPDPARPGGRVAVIGSDPYPQDTVVSETLRKLVKQSLLYTGHFEGGVQ